MDWHMIWAIAQATPSEIIMLILLIAACATYFIYVFCHTGLMMSLTAFAAMASSGLLGHVYFSMNGIFFAYDRANTAIFGAALSMTACFVLSIFIIRVITDAVYNSYPPPKKEEDETIETLETFEMQSRIRKAIQNRR